MPNIGPTSVSPEVLLDYLRTHVRLDDGCKRWAGTYSIHGYPVIAWRYRKYPVRRLLLGLIAGNPLAKNKRVYDTCGNRWCVNEEHLRVGLQSTIIRNAQENMRYPTGRQKSLAIALGRARKAKLPITERANVLRMQSEGLSYKRIGEHYGVTPSAVGHALKAWNRIYGITL